MLNPFIDLIGSVIHLYTLVIIVWVVLSLLIQFDVVNRYNRLISQVFSVLGQLVEPALKPIRRFMRRILPQLFAIDLSPIILLLLLSFINNAMYTWFYDHTPRRVMTITTP